MGRVLLTMAVVLAMVAGDRAEAGEMKIGFVDLQRALNECDAGKGARKRFLGEMEAKQARLRKEKEALDGKREEFDKKAMVLREKERQSMEQQLEDQSLAFKRKYEDYQKELKRMDSEYTGTILKDLETIIGALGSEGAYTAIFEMQNSGIVYGDPAADLTDEVIRRYNTKK